MCIITCEKCLIKDKCCDSNTKQLIHRDITPCEICLFRFKECVDGNINGDTCAIDNCYFQINADLYNKIYNSKKGDM